MKNIFEPIIGVLGLIICMLSAQISAFNWNTYNPFYYFVPIERLQQNTAADEIAGDTSFALDSAGRSFIDKVVSLKLQSELTEMRRAFEQLTSQREMDLNAIQIKLNEKATKADLDKTKMTVEGIASDLNTIQIKLNEKATKADLDSTKTTVEGIASNLLTLTQRFEKEIAVVDIGHIPESCTDLKTIGYKMNGIFQVKGTTQLETVYCDFTSNAPNLQKLIGYADVKSAPVHFHAETSAPFQTTGTPILFDVLPINVGNAIDLSSGIFTAPRSGIYSFSFRALPSFYIEQSLILVDGRVGFYLNGVRVGKGGAAEVQNTDDNLWSPLTLNLKSGDQVWLERSQVNPDFYSYYLFTGFMLEEEIVASL